MGGALKHHYSLAELGIPEPDRCRCGKIRYGDELTALAVLAAKAGYCGVIAVYLCPLCDGWHLTSKR